MPIKSNTSVAIPRISLSWQQFISNDICLEKTDPTNASVRKKKCKRSSCLIKHQKAHTERDTKVPNVRKASVWPCSQPRMLQDWRYLSCAHPASKSAMLTFATGGGNASSLASPFLISSGSHSVAQSVPVVRNS